MVTLEEWWEKACEDIPQLRNRRLEDYFENVEGLSCKWANKTIPESHIWGQVRNEAKQWEKEYNNEIGYTLFEDRSQFDKFDYKKREKIANKSYRCSLIDKGRAVDPKIMWNIDKYGTKIPNLEVLNDLVRTRITCEWQDGVIFLSQKLESFARKNNMLYDFGPRSKFERGYFAQHFYLKHKNVAIEDVSGTKNVDLIYEVQIATKMQTAVWDASHKVFEFWRDERAPYTGWNIDDPNFIPNQIGNTIQLIDGVLLKHRIDFDEWLKDKAFKKIFPFSQYDTNPVLVIVPDQSHDADKKKEPLKAGVATTNEDAMAQSIVAGGLAKRKIKFETYIRNVDKKDLVKESHLFLLGGEFGNDLSKDLYSSEVFRKSCHFFKNDGKHYHIRRPNGTAEGARVHKNLSAEFPKNGEEDYGIIASLPNPWSDSVPKKWIFFVAGCYALATWGVADYLLNHTNQFIKDLQEKIDEIEKGFSCVVRFTNIGDNKSPQPRTEKLVEAIQLS